MRMSKQCFCGESISRHGLEFPVAYLIQQIEVNIRTKLYSKGKTKNTMIIVVYQNV